jgi:hypothetical protein
MEVTAVNADLLSSLEKNKALLWTFQEIPRLWQNLILKSHKNRDERFKLFVFLWSNGMPPLEARKVVMWHHGKTTQYDRSAWQGIAAAVKLTEDESGREYLRKIHVWDYILGRVTKPSDFATHTARAATRTQTRSWEDWKLTDVEREQFQLEDALEHAEWVYENKRPRQYTKRLRKFPRDA